MNYQENEHDWIGFCKAFFLSAFSFFFSFTGVEYFLKISLLAVSIAYTAWKFYTDYQRNKK